MYISQHAAYTDIKSKVSSKDNESLDLDYLNCDYCAASDRDWTELICVV